jgi:hypothetical protein
VVVVPCEAIVPPVANRVTLGREALIGVWISCRTNSLCKSDLVRSMGVAEARDTKSPRSCAGYFIVARKMLKLYQFKNYTFHVAT